MIEYKYNKGKKDNKKYFNYIKQYYDNNNIYYDYHNLQILISSNYFDDEFFKNILYLGIFYIVNSEGVKEITETENTFSFKIITYDIYFPYKLHKIQISPSNDEWKYYIINQCYDASNKFKYHSVLIGPPRTEYSLYDIYGLDEVKKFMFVSGNGKKFKEYYYQIFRILNAYRMFDVKLTYYK